MVQTKQLTTVAEKTVCCRMFKEDAEDELKTAEPTTLPQQESANIDGVQASAKQMKKRNHCKAPAVLKKKSESTVANALFSAQVTREESQTQAQSTMNSAHLSDGPKQWVHIPQPKDPRQHSQTCPKSTGRTQASQGPTHPSFTASHVSVSALQPFQLGSKQSSLRADPKSSWTPDTTVQGPGQQPSLTLYESTGNAKRWIGGVSFNIGSKRSTCDDEVFGAPALELVS